MQTYKHSERTDVRRKPRFPRLEIRRRRQNQEKELRELEKLEFYQRPTMIAH